MNSAHSFYPRIDNNTNNKFMIDDLGDSIQYLNQMNASVLAVMGKAAVILQV